MQPKLSVIRTIGTMMIEDVLKIITIVVGIVLVSLLGLSWWLTANVSAWWGILLGTVVLLIIFAMVLRFFAMSILKRMYPAPLSSEQKNQTRSFVGKLQNLAGVRTMGWPAFILMNIKDVVRHRDFTGLRQMVNDTKGLRQDFQELERLFIKRS